MTDRDRNDSRYDRNEARFAGRDDPYAQDRQERQGSDAQEWERRARDWERGGADDYARGQHARDLRGQHNELRSQGRGFRDQDYGHQGYDQQRFDRERAYAGPTGSYSGYRDDRNDWNEQRSQGAGWQGNPSYQGNYGSQGSYGARGNSGWQGNTQRFGAYSNQSNQREPRLGQSYGQNSSDRHYGRSSYEVEGARGEYRGREEDSFGQQLRDGANAVVRSVKRAFRGPKGYKRSDDRIREDVSDRLAQQDQVDPSDIEVQVQNGEVTLSGTVQSRHEKFLAEEIADDVSGVSDVHNQLRVRRENEQRNNTTSSTLTGQNEPNRVRNGHV